MLFRPVAKISIIPSVLQVLEVNFMILVFLLNFINFSENDGNSLKSAISAKTLNSCILLPKQKTSQKSQFWRVKTLCQSNISSFGRKICMFSPFSLKIIKSMICEKIMENQEMSENEQKVQKTHFSAPGRKCCSSTRFSMVWGVDFTHLGDFHHNW